VTHIEVLFFGFRLTGFGGAQIMVGIKHLNILDDYFWKIEVRKREGALTLPLIPSSSEEETAVTEVIGSKGKMVK
jgi:hypothetical protein